TCALPISSSGMRNACPSSEQEARHVKNPRVPAERRGTKRDDGSRRDDAVSSGDVECLIAVTTRVSRWTVVGRQTPSLDVEVAKRANVCGVLLQGSSAASRNLP